MLLIVGILVSILGARGYSKEWHQSIQKYTGRRNEYSCLEWFDRSRKILYSN